MRFYSYWAGYGRYQVLFDSMIESGKYSALFDGFQKIYHGYHCEGDNVNEVIADKRIPWCSDTKQFALLCKDKGAMRAAQYVESSEHYSSELEFAMDEIIFIESND
jgi:phosphatidylethanolamine-binding protein (PEBP) family uncharacterized protein